MAAPPPEESFLPRLITREFNGLSSARGEFYFRAAVHRLAPSDEGAPTPAGGGGTICPLTSICFLTIWGLPAPKPLGSLF